LAGGDDVPWVHTPGVALAQVRAGERYAAAHVVAGRRVDLAAPDSFVQPTLPDALTLELRACLFEPAGEARPVGVVQPGRVHSQAVRLWLMMRGGLKIPCESVKFM